MAPERTKPLLIGESFSPWTKKARWALEYCGVPYDYEEYTPTLSEPGLRWRLGQWITGTVSVPVLLAANGKICRDSWEIACYANENSVVGDGNNSNNRRCFFGDDNNNNLLEQIKAWNDRSEAALAEGRTAVVRRVLSSDDALEEVLPSFVPRQLRPYLRFTARFALGRLDHKYAHLVEPGALREALVHTRECLAKAGGGDYLLGSHFSYADITMAVVLEIIAPIATHEPPLGPATLQCWNDPELAGDFQDLLDWRNRLAAAKATSFSQFSSEWSR